MGSDVLASMVDDLQLYTANWAGCIPIVTSVVVFFNFIKSSSGFLLFLLMK